MPKNVIIRVARTEAEDDTQKRDVGGSHGGGGGSHGGGGGSHGGGGISRGGSTSRGVFGKAPQTHPSVSHHPVIIPSKPVGAPAKHSHPIGAKPTPTPHGGARPIGARPIGTRPIGRSVPPALRGHLTPAHPPSHIHPPPHLPRPLHHPYPYYYRWLYPPPLLWYPYWWWYPWYPSGLLIGGVLGVETGILTGLVLNDVEEQYEQKHEQPMISCADVDPMWIAKDENGAGMCSTLKDGRQVCFFERPQEGDTPPKRDICVIPS